ncbi:hypothetical protein HY485_01750 [Candidatus Woesearchaeota archaeon]|nr:hypothetical protein [Candidatus Woesearchaeota archaeon]
MLNVEHSPNFLSVVAKIKNAGEKERIRKLIKKIIEVPEIGKPMRYSRQGTREVYAGSFRLSYSYVKKEDKLIFLDLYRKGG